MRRPGHRRQLLGLHCRCRRTAAAPGLPDRRGGRRRLVRDHQARRHRRRGHRRHRHRAAALRDRSARATSARTSPPDLDTIELSQDGPDRVADHRRPRRGPAAAAQGLRQRARRLPQHLRVRAHRARHRGEGRRGSRSSSTPALDREPRSPGRRTRHRPARRRHRGGGLRPAALHGDGPLARTRSVAPSPPPPSSSALASLPRLHDDRPARAPARRTASTAPSTSTARAVAHTVVHADGTAARRSADPPTAPTCAPVARSGRRPIAARRDGARPDPPRAARHVRARPLRRQGRRRQPRAVGGARRLEQVRRAGRLAARAGHRRAGPRAAPGGRASCRSTVHPLPNLGGGELRASTGCSARAWPRRRRFDPQAKGLGEWARGRTSMRRTIRRRQLTCEHLDRTASARQLRGARAARVRPSARSLPSPRRSGRTPARSRASCTARPPTHGLLGVAFPEEVGGEGGDLLDTDRAAGGDVRGGRLERADGGAVHPRDRAAAHRGARDRRTWSTASCGPTLAGETIGCAGDHRARRRLRRRGICAPRAVRDGDHYVVNGAKTFITSGVRADFVTTAVRTGGPGARRRLACWWSRRARPGSPSTAALDKMGWHCSDTAELSFADVRVPVGEPGRRGELRLLADRRAVRRRADRRWPCRPTGSPQRCLDLTAGVLPRPRDLRPAADLAARWCRTPAGRDGAPDRGRPRLHPRASPPGTLAGETT